MANISEVDEFTAAVYELATTDPLEGGPGGALNLAIQALANRTLFLKNRVEEVWKTGDTKEVVCDAAYITANFEVDGLGKSDGERAGWAIRNGNNGTDDMGGFVSVGSGNGFIIGTGGGSADAVVVSHTHTIGHTHGYKDAYYFEDSSIGGTSISGTISVGGNYTGSGDTNNDNDTLYYRNATTDSISNSNSGSAGVSGTGKNMQPYKVVLKIMKI